MAEEKNIILISCGVGHVKRILLLVLIKYKVGVWFLRTWEQNPK